MSVLWTKEQMEELKKLLKLMKNDDISLDDCNKFKLYRDDSGQDE